MGVDGNEEVDNVAKQALKLSHIEIIIPLSKDVTVKIRTTINGKWQKLWNEEGRGRHLYCIQNQVGGERAHFGS